MMARTAKRRAKNETNAPEKEDDRGRVKHFVSTTDKHPEVQVREIFVVEVLDGC